MHWRFPGLESGTCVAWRVRENLVIVGSVLVAPTPRSSTKSVHLEGRIAFRKSYCATRDVSGRKLERGTLLGHAAGVHTKTAGSFHALRQTSVPPPIRAHGPLGFCPTSVLSAAWPSVSLGQPWSWMGHQKHCRPFVHPSGTCS